MVLASIVLAGLMLMLGVGYVIQQNPQAFLAFAVGSVPDGYGNKIRQVWINQIRLGQGWSTSIDYETYQSGMTINVTANCPTWIIVAVNINTTLCPGGQGQADDLTRAYLSVSGVKTNELMTWLTTQELDAGFFTVSFNSTAWTPSPSVVYTVTLNYQAYY